LQFKFLSESVAAEHPFEHGTVALFPNSQKCFVKVGDVIKVGDAEGIVTETKRENAKPMFSFSSCSLSLYEALSEALSEGTSC
jgi:hypothetical protein